MFANMEELGESNARKQFAKAHPSQVDTLQLPSIHDSSVDGAMSELQQQAHLAEQIASHPGRFQMGAHGVQGPEQGIPGAGLAPSVAFPGTDKVNAELRLSAADAKLAKAMKAQTAAAKPVAKPVAKPSPNAKPPAKPGATGADPTGGKGTPSAKDQSKAQTAKKRKTDPQVAAKAEAKEAKNEAQGKAAGDPFAGSAAPPANKRKNVPGVEVAAAKATDITTKKDVEPLAAPQKVPIVKNKATSKKASGQKPAAKKPATNEPTGKKVGKKKVYKGAPKTQHDYFMDAARAMRNGVPAGALLAMAKKAYAIHNKAKARAYLAAAEEVAAKEQKKKLNQKPPENLLDILRRKQGKAKKMNPVALAANRAVNSFGKEITQEDVAKAKKHVGETKVPVTADAVLSELHKTAANPDAADEISEFTDAAAKEQLDAETHLLATQKAASVAIAKAKARVMKAMARSKTRRNKIMQKKAKALLKKKIAKADKIVQKRADNLFKKKVPRSKMVARKYSLGQMLTLLSQKLQKGQFSKEAKGKGPMHGAGDEFGFGGKKQKLKKKTAEKASVDSPKHRVKLQEKKAVRNNSFGFGKMSTPNKNEALKPTAELGESLHLWINNKPIHNAKPKKMHSTQKAATRKTSTLTSSTANSEKAASRLADMEHIWINGKPVVSKKSSKKKTAVVKKVVDIKKVKKQELGEEGLEQMRAMRITAGHEGGTSQSIEDQNKYNADSEYRFSIHNTDKDGHPMGIAKKVFLNVKLPKGAQVSDAYFYLEAVGKEDPKSLNCKIAHGDAKTKPSVNCMVPQVKDLLDVYVRAHYNGDQKALTKFANDKVHATLHEGKTVLSTTKISAVKKMKLLKRMPLPN